MQNLLFFDHVQFIAIFVKMKFALLCTTAMLIGIAAHAQPCDYSIKKYAIRSEINTSYGIAKAFSTKTDTLYLDVYKPINDKNTLRPIILFIHGGGFSGGNYKDVTNQAKAFAARGYVAATASYRLGFFRPVVPDNYPFALDKAEPERAAYRAIQDIKGAVRFLKGRNKADSSDVTNFFIGGFSAGAIISLNVAFANGSKFKPATCDSINTIVFQGYSYKRPDLGPIDGTLNINGQNNSVRGVLNYFGGVWDTTALETATPAVFNYHQLGDPVVPAGINKPYYGLGFGISDNYPWVFGSTIISRRLKALGYTGNQLRNRIISGNAHDVDNPALMDTMTANWASSVICSAVAKVQKPNRQSVFSVINQDNQKAILAHADAEVVIYDLAGKQLSKQLVKTGEQIALNISPCLVRYHSNSGNGAFLCSP